MVEVRIRVRCGRNTLAITHLIEVRTMGGPISLLVVVVLAGTSSYAQPNAGSAAQTPTRPAATEARIFVNLKVECENKDLQAQLASFIAREFRSLADVALVDDEHAEYAVSIVALETANRGGRNTGIALSTLVTARFPPGQIDFIASELSEDLRAGVGADLKRYVTVEDHLLNTGADVRKIAETLVTNIDTRTFEPARQTTEKIKRLMERVRDKR